VTEVARDLLPGRWVHAHEEDTDTEMVFRPAEFTLPPSRGRLSFEFRPDGRLVEWGIGPTDVPEEVEGTWELQGDRLVLERPGTAQGTRVFHVGSVGPDRLTLVR
jgi:hypothetical protein